VRELGFHTYCALPLRHRGSTVGVLGVASLDPEKLCSDRELRLLEAIGERLAAAIESSRLHERVLDGAVLEERMRIARELHDGLAQVLGYINTQTLAVMKLLDSGQGAQARTELAAMDEAARDVYADVRQEILGLRLSLGRRGLVPILSKYLADYERTAGASLRLEANGDLDGLELPPSTEIQLVRIVQEALANVRKHANATEAVVRVVTAAGALTLEIEDDGRGFVQKTGATGWPRFGLQTMRERAQAVGGEFELDSAPGRGTRVRVRVPLTRPLQVAHAGLAG
jgi:signal transduction histidine kinase